MTEAQKDLYWVLIKEMDNGPEHRAIRSQHISPVQVADKFHNLVIARCKADA